MQLVKIKKWDKVKLKETFKEKSNKHSKEQSIIDLCPTLADDDLTIENESEDDNEGNRNQGKHKND